MHKIFNKECIRFFILYTIIFFITSTLVFFELLIQDKGFLWKRDAVFTHIPIFIYYSEYLKTIFYNIINGIFEIPLFDFRLEAGGDIISLLHMHLLGDPLALIAIFFDKDNIEYCYNILVILRFYLAGISFAIFCRYLKRYNNIYIIAGAMTYALSIFCIFESIRYPYYANAMIYFPLIILGIEKLIREDKKLFLIVTTFIASITNFIFFYMIIVGAFLYFIVRIVYIKNKNYKEKINIILKGTISVLLGMGMASFIIFPVINLILNGSRLESGYILPYKYVYDIKYYISFIQQFFIGYQSIGFWTILHFPSIVLFSIGVIFINKKFKSYRILFLGGTLIYLIPYLGYALNGFSYLANKSLFIYCFLISFLLVITLETIVSYIKFKSKYIIYILYTYILLCILLYIVEFLFNIVDLETANMFLINNIITIIFLLFFILIIRKINMGLEKYICVIILINVIFNANYLFSPYGGNHANIILKNKEIYNYDIFDKKNTMAEKDDIFERIIINDGNLETGCASLRENFYSMKSVYTLKSKEYTDFYSYFLLPRTILGIGDIDNRPILTSISAIKEIYNINNYVVEPFKASKMSFNFYKNNNALPISFTYDNYFLMDNNINPLDVEGMLLDSVLLDKEIKNYDKVKINTRVNRIDSSIVYDDKIKIKNDILLSKRKNSEIYIKYNDKFKREGQYFLYFKVLSFLNDKKILGKGETSNISIISKGLKKDLSLTSPYHNFHVPNKRFLINLGTENINDIKIIFEKKGKYEFAEPQILFLPLDNYEEKIAKLKENALQNINIGTNKISGDITVDKKKLLFFSVPYSKGWEAFVDGEKTDIYKANIMYMAIPLEAGNHHIELKYRTPYLDLGIGVSIVSLILSIIWIMYLKRKNKEIRNEKN